MNKTEKRIVFIGGGNMAQAIIGGLVQQGTSPAALTVVEPDAAKRELLAQRFGINTLAIGEALGDIDVAVLAVKPQQLREVVLANQVWLKDTLVISIAAGIRLGDLDRWLSGAARLVRVMPNTPALVRAGISGAYAGPGCLESDIEVTTEILNAVGRVIWVNEEAEIDAVTAISGSGPAYVFYFIEALSKAARNLGFDAETADILAKTTFHGAIKLAMDSEDDIVLLRQKVTSKGGTTEAAIASLSEAGLEQMVCLATQAANTRARELADELGRD